MTSITLKPSLRKFTCTETTRSWPDFCDCINPIWCDCKMRIEKPA